MVSYFGGIIIYIAIFHIWFADFHKPLPLNELGDFLAGIFAPIAFLYLYLGYHQQGQELQQNTKALQLQAEELRISNQSLQQQVLEMQKSVEAQQNMFNLAERQYAEVREEKEQKNRPNIKCFFKNFKDLTQSASSQYTFILDLIILNQGVAIVDLKIQSNFWTLWYKNRTVSAGLQITNISIDEQAEISLKLVRGDRVVPFDNNLITFIYKDINGEKYKETIKIEKIGDEIESIKSA